VITGNSSGKGIGIGRGILVLSERVQVAGGVLLEIDNRRSESSSEFHRQRWENMVQVWLIQSTVKSSVVNISVIKLTRQEKANNKRDAEWWKMVGLGS